MRLERWSKLPLARRELQRVRLRRATRAGVLFGVAMGLFYASDSTWFGGARPDDPAWKPLVMGLWNGAFMFAITFFMPRLRIFRDDDEQMRELVENAEMEAEAERQSKE